MLLPLIFMSIFRHLKFEWSSFMQSLTMFGNAQLSDMRCYKNVILNLHSYLNSVFKIINLTPIPIIKCKCTFHLKCCLSLNAISLEMFLNLNSILPELCFGRIIKYLCFTKLLHFAETFSTLASQSSLRIIVKVVVKGNEISKLPLCGSTIMAFWSFPYKVADSY